MKIVETAVEIEKNIESHCTEKIIMRFGVLYMSFHVNLCLRKNCCSCKFVNEFVIFLLQTDFSAKKKCFQRQCCIYHKEFYDFHRLLISLAEREKKVRFRQ